MIADRELAPGDIPADLEMAMQLAVQGLKAQRDNAESLSVFMQRMYPGYQFPRFIRFLIDRLERAAATPGTRLMVIVPRRHGKSLLVSEHFPAWVLGRFPEQRVIGVAHTLPLARRFSHRVRSKFRLRKWPFPRVRIADDRGAVDAWDIAGSLQGGYSAFGMGGSPTGLGADLLLIDDPIRSREDAMSANVREAVYESYRGTLRPTLNAGGSIILITTRWHYDDLAGRLLAEADKGGEQWELLHLDAICEDPEHDPLKREEGEALWPEVWPLHELAKVRSAVGEEWWQTQYQGRPSKPGGDTIHIEWFPPYDRVPPYAKRIVQSWDTSFKTGKRHDYTVCITAAVGANETYILDVFVARLEWPALQRAYVMQTRAWQPAESLIEDKASGISLIQWARSGECKTTSPVIAMPNVEGLEALVNLASPYWEAASVRIAKDAHWRQALLEELGAYPNGAHDDQVSALTHLTLRLYNRRNTHTARSTSYIEGGDPDELEEIEAWQRTQTR